VDIAWEPSNKMLFSPRSKVSLNSPPYFLFAPTLELSFLTLYRLQMVNKMYDIESTDVGVVHQLGSEELNFIYLNIININVR
jgi:hypothetical protein